MTRAVSAEAKQPRPIPGRIGGVLKVVHTLITYARSFAANAAARVEMAEFAPIAAVFGTYDLQVILLRLRRGTLRLLALQRYLLARAARGRDLRFAWRNSAEPQPHHRPPPHLLQSGPEKPKRQPRAPLPKRRPDPATLGPDDPRAFHMPTQEEADAWVRRRPVGKVIASICLDLGVVPGLCGEDLFDRLYNVYRRYGDGLVRMYKVRAEREKTFWRERDRRPETWHIDWRDMRGPATRRLLGGLIGDAPPADGLMQGVPAAAPS